MWNYEDLPFRGSSVWNYEYSVPRLNMTKRQLPCGGCQIPINLSKDRLRELVLADRKPLCQQCRRYVSTAPVVYHYEGETEEKAIGLAHKQGPRAKCKRGIESKPLKRLE